MSRVRESENEIETQNLEELLFLLKCEINEVALNGFSGYKRLSVFESVCIVCDKFKILYKEEAVSNTVTAIAESVTKNNCFNDNEIKSILVNHNIFKNIQ